MAKGNPNPSPQTRFKPLGNQPLSRTARGAKFPMQADEALAAMGKEKSAYIRAAVIEKLQADGLLEFQN